MVQLIALLVLLFAIHLLVTLTMCALFRVPVAEAALFYGPAIFKYKRGDITWRINALPLGSYVKIQVDDWELTDSEPQRINRSQVGNGTLIPISLSSTGCFFLIALISLGTAEAIRTMGTILSKLLWGSLQPIDAGSVYLSNFYAYATGAPLLELSGVLAAFFFVFHMLFVSQLTPAGQAFRLGLDAFNLPERVTRMYVVTSTLLTTVVALAWIIALIAAVMN